MSITRRLTTANPRNMERLHDLSVSYERIAEIEQARGDSAAAFRSHQAGWAAAEQRATGEPQNTAAQLEFVSWCWILGRPGGGGQDVVRQRALEQGLARVMRLQSGGRLPGALAGWVPLFRRALSRIYSPEVGVRARRRLDSAGECYCPFIWIIVIVLLLLLMPYRAGGTGWFWRAGQEILEVGDQLAAAGAMSSRLLNPRRAQLAGSYRSARPQFPINDGQD